MLRPPLSFLLPLSRLLTPTSQLSKLPPPWRTNQFFPFSRSLRLPSTPRPPNPPPSNANNSSALPPDDLLASTPELECLAHKSSDAPVLSRVVSYNLLSSSLSTAPQFPGCDPANLLPSTRLKRILIKLEGAVASRSIICLQEVSLNWSGILHKFFANRGFHLMLASHGSYFNGYMGEGLAFPLDLYEAIDLRIERLTDSMRWPSTPQRVSNIFTRLSKAFNVLFNMPRPKREPWEHARGRHNRFLFARLRSRINNAIICVGTYHMPCVFYSPPVMMIHSALVVRTFQQLCNNDHGVLAGDFNIKPTDACYNMILSGKPDANHLDYPTRTPDGTPVSKWFPMPLAPMKSAYLQVLGEEPDFTNFAKVRDNPVFIETLDYLFCTEQVDVVDVVRLPRRDAVKGPYPDELEPSDHLMIGATIRLAPGGRRNG